MNYCSLDDAYGVPGSSSSSSGIAEAGRQARKEERKKAKRCKGPPLAFMELGGQDPQRPYEQPPALDPDRQAQGRLPLKPAMNNRIGMREHVPVTAPDGEAEPFTVQGQTTTTGPVGSVEDNLADQRKYEYLEQRTDDDEEGDKERNTLPSPKQIMGVLPSSSSFFGKDPSIDEPFSNYQPDAKNYLMEPNFMAAFNKYTGNTATTVTGSPAVLPIPSVRDVWKPLTPGGANTAYFESLPRPGGRYPVSKDGNSHESLSRKIDTIMERLDLMNKGPTAEQNQTDILLFVSSGIFILFMMDLLVRKGTTTRFLTGL